MSAATVMRLVPEHHMPRALAIVNGGNALATVVAAPLGSYLGAMVGWRGTFFCLVPVAALALAWKLASLPSMPSASKVSAGRAFALLKRPPVALGMLAVSLFFMGQFALFTYLRPFLELKTQADASLLSLLLLVIGVAGLVGTTLIGALLKDGLFRILVVIPLIMALIAVGLPVFGASAIATALLLAAWGLVGTSAPVAWFTWLAKALPDGRHQTLEGQDHSAPFSAAPAVAAALVEFFGR